MPLIYKHYTVGFYFNVNLSKVALIRKGKPEWQKGLLNGVGGRIEEGEQILDCMEREFEEEATGYLVRGWTHFITGDITCHQGPCIVHYFVMKGPEFVPIINEAEQVIWFLIDEVFQKSPVPNLSWMLPMAMLKLINNTWQESAIWRTV